MMAELSPLYQITIERILYQFDEPVLFVAKVGHFSALFLKLDEDESTQQFLSCYIDKAHVSGLSEGRLSIRGAFESQEDKFIVVANEHYQVLEEWRASPEELTEGILPARNVGILSRFGHCPDVLQEKDAFLSVYFSGAGLNRKHIMLSTLMGLLGSVQEFARTQVLPPSLRGKRHSTVDFLVGDPALGSLMISIKAPTFKLSNIRRANDQRDLSAEDVEVGLARQKDEVMKGIEDLIDSPNDVRDREIDEGGDFYSSLERLLPSNDTPFTSVTFTSQAGDLFRRVSVTREQAEAVRTAYNTGDGTNGSRVGVVVEINAASRTMLLRSPAGDVATCSFEQSLFDDVTNEVDFGLGSRISVNGEIWERPRRDFIRVQRARILPKRPRRN